MATAELLAVSNQLLAAIDAGDWKSYASLCDEGITCFEKEAHGHLISGLPFHKYYFDQPAPPSDLPAGLSSMSSPDVRVVGDVGIVCYVRLKQSTGSDGSVNVSATDETRIWKKTSDGWKHIHVHRSPC